ncbi:MAG TPA: hypothetical protein PLN52_16625 [Opitutaceae bacterium]|nr:hypothetical protein [Opitutaceae bacterium]
MTDPWTNERWEEALRRIFRKAMLEPEFRKLALSDPKSAFEKANGQPAPDHFRLRFVESLEEQVLVLPRSIVGQGSLSEIDISRILHHALRHQPITPVAGTPASC